MAFTALAVLLLASVARAASPCPDLLSATTVPAGIPQLTANSSSPFPSPPDLESLEDQVRFIRELRRTFPNLLNESHHYDFNPLTILVDQQRLQSVLNGSPEYQQAMQDRPPLLEVEVRNQRGPGAPEYLLSTDMAKAWLEDQLNRLKRVTDASSASSLTNAMDAEAQRLLLELGNRDASRMILEWTQTLPQHLRAPIHRETQLERKLQLLAEASQYRTPPELQYRNLGFHSLPTVDQLQQEILRLSRARAELRSLTILNAALQDAHGETPSDLETGTHRLEERANEWTNVPMAQQEWKRRFNAFLTQQEGEPHEDSDIGARKKEINAITTLLEETFEKRISLQSQQGDSVMRLVELPPAVALFRGCAGGDCSTKYGFPYPNAPHEHVFAVLNEAGLPKGYVSGSVVDSDKKVAFYLQTINGPRISSEEALQILEAMNQLASNWGAELLLLPTTEKIDSLVNYPALRAAFSVVASSQTTPLVYRDQGTREMIEAFTAENNTSDYEKMGSNAEARFYEPPRRENGTRLSVAPRELLSPKADPLTPSDYLELAVESARGDRTTLTAELVEAAKVKAEAWKAFTIALVNPRHLALAEYSSLIRNSWIDLGGSSEGFQSVVPAMAIGKLRSSDIPSEPELATDLITNLITNPRIQDMHRLAFTLKEGLATFSKLPVFDSAIEAIISQGNSQAHRQLISLFLDPGMIAHPSFRAWIFKLAESKTGSTRGLLNWTLLPDPNIRNRADYVDLCLGIALRGNNFYNRSEVDTQISSTLKEMSKSHPDDPRIPELEELIRVLRRPREESVTQGLIELQQRRVTRPI